MMLFFMLSFILYTRCSKNVDMYSQKEFAYNEQGRVT